MNEQSSAEIADEQSARLPLSGWWPFLAGAAAGILLRLVFSGRPGGAFSAMSGSFVYLAPTLVSAVAIFVAERKQPRSWRYYMRAGAVANALFVLGTLLFFIEGIICAILIVPMFSVIGAMTGLLMGAICRVGRWARHALYGFAALPIVLAAIEPIAPLPEQDGVAAHSKIVYASPQAIWRQLENARDIRPPEIDTAWMYRIGVPLPLEGKTEIVGGQAVRHIRMGKGIHFDQVATDWEPGRRVTWTYRFFEDSFPSGSLDDHVKIGGEYFDLKETTYTVTPADEGTSRLTIQMRYRVSTRFNWYARPIAQFLVENFSEVILDFYAARAEAQRT